MTKIKTIARQDQIVDLLVEGKTIYQIAESIGVNEKTVRRDIKKVHERMPEKKDCAFVQLLATKEALLRQSILLYGECKSGKEKLEALAVRIKLLESLEKTYERFGLLPNMSDIDRMHGRPSSDLVEILKSMN